MDAKRKTDQPQPRTPKAFGGTFSGVKMDQPSSRSAGLWRASCRFTRMGETLGAFTNHRMNRSSSLPCFCSLASTLLRLNLCGFA
jgi:hypothetical protein